MLFIFAREAAGALSARHSLRPLIFGGTLLANLGRFHVAGCASVWLFENLHLAPN
jgi:hypothetical protein